MAKAESGFSKGGKSNGLSERDISKRLPDVKEFSLDRPPQLEGSEKQIAWAKKIRAEFVPKLAQSIFAYNQDLVKAINGGKEAAAKSIYESAVNTFKNRYSYISDKKEAERLTNKDIADYVKREVSTYNTLANRVKALNQLAQNKSAKFWIDNRNSYDEIRKRILGTK